MRPSRPLLRLDEKVAAETRRLAALGGRPRPLAILAAVAGAATLHAMLAALPLPPLPLSPRSSSLPPELPTVWRWGPPVAVPDQKPASPPAGSNPAAPPHPALLQVRPDDVEPVPEPLPELPAGAIPAEVEAMIPAPAPLPSAQGATEAPAARGPEAADAIPVVRVNPVYPMVARSLRAEGTVALDLTVRPDGSVEDAVVAGCTRPGVGFEDAALAAVRRWRFPAVEGDASRHLAIHVDFKGQESRP